MAAESYKGPTSDKGMRVKGSGLAVLLVLVAATLASSAARAQEGSGAVIQQLVDVDPMGNVGAAGCGGGGGAQLDITLGGDGDPGSRALADRFDLFRYCDAIAQGSANGWRGDANITETQQSSQALALAPEEIFAGVDQSAAVFDVQLANITQRLQVLRTARLHREEGVVVARSRRDPSWPVASAFGAGLLESGLDSLTAMAMAEGAHVQVSSEGEPGRLGFFVNGRIHLVDIDSNRAESGSDSFGGGITLGGDLRFADWGYAGLSFGYTRLDTRYSRSSSEADLDSYAFSAYGMVYPTDQIYIDAIVTGSILRFDTDNNLVIFDGGPDLDRLSGEADGWTIGGSVGAGGEIPLGPVIFGPFLRGDVLHTHFDAFTQSGGDGTLNLRIDCKRSTIPMFRFELI